MLRQFTVSAESTRNDGPPPWDFLMRFDATSADITTAIKRLQRVLVGRLSSAAEWAIDRCIPLRIVLDTIQRLTSETLIVRGKFEESFAAAEHEFLCEYDPRTKECARITG